jgi:histidyl-tRNA synthetase
MARTEPARGMRDFLPDDVRRREYVIDIIKRVYERYGFEPLETPAVENIETLLGKYGEEGNRLIFKILKRGEHEASGQADLALRYDLTVPLARVIAEHHAKLPRLFKRYQIQPVWRADRPARGRFREFYQCDVDALGSTSPAVEAELCGAVSDAMGELGFSDYTIRLNHRHMLTALLDAAGIALPMHGDALVAIDKLDKIGPEGVTNELRERGVSATSAQYLLRVVAAGDTAPDGLAELQRLDTVLQGHDAGVAGVANLRAILMLCQETSARGRIRVDASLARGLSYYTGALVEINVADLAGSLGGGGRYDNLVGMFSGDAIPACGVSLGLERILVVMGERGMFPPAIMTTPAEVLVSVFRPEDLGQALHVAGILRRGDLHVMVYPDADKIGKQIKFASSRNIPCIAILGEDEIAHGQVAVKFLATGQQEVYALGDAAAAVKGRLGEMRG